MTIFLGCGFGAKYREGGGVLSVPLQWMLGLWRLKQDAIWLELLPATDDPGAQPSWTRLPAARIVASLENVLSAGGHEASSTPATFGDSQIHDDRSMVLERGSGSERQVSRSLEKIRLRTLSRSAETDSRSAL